jgi:Na+/H+-dicarboxylate symporter/ABC-type amino acid transport substrate-binding protein
VTDSGARPLARRLVAGLVAGAFTGLFLGDDARVFEAAADGFVKLLQMAVLPYVVVSIIGSIGALRPAELRRLGTRTALVLVGLWTLALVFTLLMPLVFPPAVSGSFFSTTLVERPPPFNVIDTYIPANPFFALANAVVPAVVVFSMAVGIALIGVPQKASLLEVLDTFGAALGRIMRFVVTLTPYGIFAIAATTAGTLRFEQASRLEIYLVAYAAFALVFALWVLPGLVSTLTPIPMRAIFRCTRDALLTATIAGDLFIVLPVLIAACSTLIARYAPNAPQATEMPDVIVPVAYNFPHSGKLLSASFILFAAWFSDTSIAAADYPRFALTSVVTLFGSMNVAIPSLLDLFRVPADTFQLFVAGNVINSRFGTLVAAMHTVAVTLLGTCAAVGALRWRPRALARYGAITMSLLVVVIGGTRVLGERLLVEHVRGEDVLGAMHVEPVTHAVFRADAALPADVPVQGSRLRDITARRRLRVCHLSDSLPFAFANAHGALVGYDVALVHRLAIDLGVGLEFAPVARRAAEQADGMPQLLRAGACDLVIGGLVVTTPRALTVRFSSTYLDETAGFLVPDADRRQFDSWDAIRALGPVTIGVPDVPYYVARLRARLPEARLRIVDGVEALFDHTGAAALALPAERGSAWTLRYPQYAVVVPTPQPIRLPLALALPAHEPELATFVDTWIELARKDGTLEALYEYWILGRTPAAAAPRWSIIRDVLRWQAPAHPAAPAARRPAS